MPVQVVDSEKRLRETKAKHKAEFARRMAAGNKPSLSEVLGLRPGEEFREKVKFVNSQGNEKSTMLYFFQGVPVMNCHIVAERNPKTGEYLSMMNNFWTGLAEELPSGDVISAEDALHVALENEGDLDEREKISYEAPALQINVDEHTLTARRLFKVTYSLEKETGPKRPAYLIDANTRQVVDRWNNL